MNQAICARIPGHESNFSNITIAMKTKYLIMLTIACTASVQGAPRTSANYSIATDTTDAAANEPLARTIPTTAAPG